MECENYDMNYDIIYVKNKKIEGVCLTLPQLKKTDIIYNPRKRLLILSNTRLNEIEIEEIRNEGEELLWQEKAKQHMTHTKKR